MQGKYLITVLITNYNTLDFVKLSLHSLGKLTKNNYKVLINDNGSKSEDIDELKRIAREDENVFVNFRESWNKQASFAHAEALDILTKMVDTKYTVVLDSDCTFLLKDWDERLINRLDEKTKIIGSPLPKGRSGLKPDNFPFQFAVMFETEIYKKLNISCMPRDISKGEDTCWEWKPKFINNGYKADIFVSKNTRDFKKGAFGKITGVSEYYLDGTNLVASHFGRGSSGSTVKYYDKWYFTLPVVSKITKKYTAVKEKKEWFKICNNIINKQIYA